MDENNNMLVPADFQNQYTKVSKWSQPGGTLAKVLTVVAGCAGVYALYLALPVILSMMTNAFSIACLAIGLWVLISVISNKKFRKMISTLFFLLCRKITSLAIETDPCAIIDRHTEELGKRIEKIRVSMGNFRGSIRSIENDKAKSEKELQKELELLEAYRQKNMMADSTVHSNQTIRLKELIKEYENDLKKLNLYYSMLKDLEHYTTLRVQDEKNQSDMLKKRFKRTREMYNAFSGMMSVINSETSDYDEYMMASDFMLSQIDAQMGAIDDALLNADSIMTEISVSNSVNMGKANDLLDVYEKYGIEGLFMSEDQRKALPASASGTVPVSNIGITDTDREVEYVAQKRRDILGDSASSRKYV